MSTAYEHKTELVGDDYTGLPTRPVQYRGAKKHTGLDWDQINADYIARDGQVDARGWHKGNVVVVEGNARSSSANLHSFVEADEYDEPTVAREARR